MRRGVTATHRILVPVFPVRIGAAQQKKYPCGVMVAAMESKSILERGAGSIPATGTQTGRADSRKPNLYVMMDEKKFKKFYLSGKHFRIENPNPCWKEKRGFRWDRGDCVIRALANSISCSWIDAFDYLVAKARRDFNVPNDGPGFRRWIVEDGAIWTHCPAIKGKSRMTVEEFAETHPTGRYVISVASHETACVDGVILDAWNCGHKCVVGYFDMTNFRLK